MIDIAKSIELHRNGKIPEAMLFHRLVEWIAQKPIDEILALLDEDQKGRFLTDLIAVSKPGWTTLHGWKPSEEILVTIRDYFGKSGKSSV